MKYDLLEDANKDEEPGTIFYKPETCRSKWNQVKNLDVFFTRIYIYHRHRGLLNIVLQKLCQLNVFIFVVFLITYLIHGTNYAVLIENNFQDSKEIHPLFEIVLPADQYLANFTIFTKLSLLIASLYVIYEFVNGLDETFSYWNIRTFYRTALGIEDKDLGNMTWQDIKRELIEAQRVHQMCIYKKNITELDIHNRILRKENYFVAMVNRGLIPPRIELPFIGEVTFWNDSLRYMIEFLIWSRWSPIKNVWTQHQDYKNLSERREIAGKLRTTIILLIVINIILAVPIFIWHLSYAFFKYVEGLQREPGQISTRKWSPYGKLYLRHYNELDHELLARLTKAHRPATKYIESFKSTTVSIMANYVSFLCQTIRGILIGFTVFGVDIMQYNFTLFTQLTLIIMGCKPFIIDDTMVYCSESFLKEVVVHTHYMFRGWQGKAHTQEIRRQFKQIFQNGFARIIEFTCSQFLICYVLIAWFYPMSLDIVNFFYNYTVLVDGVGYICSFAQMDVKKRSPDGSSNPLDVVPIQVQDTPDTETQNEKVELSTMHFKSANRSWMPPIETQQFTDEIKEDISPICEEEGADMSLDTNLMEDCMTSFMNRRKRRGGARSFYATDYPTSKSALELEEADTTNGVLSLHDKNDERKERRQDSQSEEESVPLLNDISPSK